MSIFVLVIGTVILLFGLAFLIAPSIIKHWFNRIPVWNLFYTPSILRIIIGVLFLLAAKDTRLPRFVTAMGVFSILAGLTIPILGRERIKAFARWGVERSNTVLRLWALVASVIGIVLVWAGL